jgi:hypothetical protein
VRGEELPRRTDGPGVAAAEREDVQAEIRKCVDRLQSMLPDATVTIQISYDRRGR